MPISVSEMRRGLLKLEAVEEEGRRHTKYTVFINDRVVACTALSRSYRELSDDMVNAIARQIYIRSRDLKKIVDCTWGYDEYVELYEQSLPRQH